LVVKVAVNSPEHVTKRKKATDRVEESLLKTHLLAGKAVPYHTHHHDRSDEQCHSGYGKTDGPHGGGEGEIGASR